jgi:hypothetical protein
LAPLLALPVPGRGQPAPSPGLPPGLAGGIAALLEEKAARTPSQRKLGSQLLFAARMQRGAPVARGIPRLRTTVEVDAEGHTLVDVRGEVGEPLLREIEARGGRVVAAVPRFGAVRARMPLASVEGLAEHPAVRRIRRADRAFTRKLDTSEGDGAHFADDARASYGVDGSGVTVGVLSDGVDALASLVSSGDLPAGVVVLPGQAGSGSEGTAMLEIVHDLAPGASLMFATAFTSQASFASNILALRAAGADVIVDDVGYFAEAVFQDDDVAAAVDQVVADGALYFSAAGNSGNLNDGTAGVWEGDFVAGPTVNGQPAHDYGGGDITNEITEASPFVYTLHWADPLGGSGNDYDLFLTNKPGTVIFAASTDVQAGSGDPFEIIGAALNDSGRQLIVVRDASSADRYLHLNANRGELGIATAGQTSGHAAARGALGVAAVDARGRSAGFTGSEPVETYSSDGPRRVFFEADGSAITPGDFSSSGGELRQKPDLSAADCVATATPGFSTFCGTSAAAPHAAAIAALLLERGGGPGLADPDDVAGALASTALDIEAAGSDRDSGVGIAQALDATGVMPVPECGVDGDCDDGLFCNGAESCDAGACLAGTPPVCSAPTPFCDDALDACSECLADGDCDDGLFCNGAESCDAGACLTGTPPVCSAPTPLCDEAQATCSECLADEDCGGGSCQAGTCVAPPVVPAASPGLHALLTLAVAAIAGLSLRRRGPRSG